MTTSPELSAFVDACIPLARAGARDQVSQLLRDLIAEPSFAASVPDFDEIETSARGWTLGGEVICHQSPELTVMLLGTLPGVVQPPHDHNMTAIIGVFEGCEEQRFWARGESGLTPTPGRMLEAGDVMTLGERAVHAISSPDGHAARAIHVYFGDIYGTDRSLFNPDTLEEHAYESDLYDQFCRPA